MPLYKKSTLKAKVKTQNSFVSPLPKLTQQKVISLLKDDYKENLPIPTKNKVLETLINTPHDGGDLLEKLKKQPFKGTSKTSTEIYKTQKTFVDENTAKKGASRNEYENSNICGNNGKLNEELIVGRSAKQKELLSKTLSDLSGINAQSPVLFNSQSSSTKKGNKGLGAEKSIIITSKIEINSNTNGDNLSPTRPYNDTPNSHLSNMLTECVMNNLRLSQQLRSPSANFMNNFGGLKLQSSKSDEQEEKELDSSLKELLDDIVSSNEILSQSMTTGDKVMQIDETSKTKETKHESNNKNEKKKSRQKKQLPKKDAEGFKSISKCKEAKNVKAENKKLSGSYKRIQVLPSSEDDMEQLGISSKKKRINKKKAIDLDKNKMEDKSVKAKKNDQKPLEIQNKDKDKEKVKNRKKEVKKSNNKPLKRCRSFPINRNNSSRSVENDGNKTNDTKKKVKKDKASSQSKPTNMIFTSSPEENEISFTELMELQEERDVGLYVYCDTCDKVRYLPDCKDPLDLPENWYCYMNPDPNYNKCSDPNYEIEPETEELVIHNKYNAGSIVWAKMDGYPWWPAMVDDDPNLADYFWLDNENSTEPSWYHVTFFDSAEVTRAWIRTAFLEPFEKNQNNAFFKSKKYNCYKQRINFAMKTAKEACQKTILDRLREYSFVVRYLKKQKNKELKKKEKKMKPNNVEQKQIVEIPAKIDPGNISDDLSDLCDNLSISSSDLSDLLKPSKGKYISMNSAYRTKYTHINDFICSTNLERI